MFCKRCGYKAGHNINTCGECRKAQNFLNNYNSKTGLNRFGLNARGQKPEVHKEEIYPTLKFREEPSLTSTFVFAFFMFFILVGIFLYKLYI